MPSRREESPLSPCLLPASPIRDPTPTDVPVPAPRGVELDEDVLAAVHDLVKVGRGQDHDSSLMG